jgi:sigma-B regulation protein RsbU (phosphoserine phosphatase)
MIKSASVHDTASFQFSVGDMLVLYSDGIVDQTNARDQSYGTDRLLTLLQGRREWKAHAVIQEIFADIDQFGLGVGATDDQTILALQANE